MDDIKQAEDKARKGKVSVDKWRSPIMENFLRREHCEAHNNEEKGQDEERRVQKVFKTLPERMTLC